MTMPKPKFDWVQWLGALLLLALMTLILSRWILRESESGHGMFIFLRWPFWAVVGLGIPLISFRLLTWRKARPRNPPKDNDGE